MTRKTRAIVAYVVLLLMVASLALPCVAYAAEEGSVQPYASQYLTSYSAYVYITSANQVQVWFDVMGTGDMDEIGTLSIKIYESSNGTTWTRVKTFSHEDYSAMLGYDDYYHSGHVSYQGSAGKQYKAYVCFWAGKNGSGDTRYMWTSVKP